MILKNAKLIHKYKISYTITQIQHAQEFINVHVYNNIIIITT